MSHRGKESERPSGVGRPLAAEGNTDKFGSLASELPTLTVKQGGTDSSNRLELQELGYRLSHDEDGITPALAGNRLWAAA